MAKKPNKGDMQISDPRDFKPAPFGASSGQQSQDILKKYEDAGGLIIDVPKQRPADAPLTNIANKTAGAPSKKFTAAFDEVVKKNVTLARKKAEKAKRDVVSNVQKHIPFKKT